MNYINMTIKMRFFSPKIYNKGLLLNRGLKNYSKKSDELYILSAVRTPIGLSKGVLSDFTPPQLISSAFREALQRAVVPSEHIKNIFLGCFSHDNCSKKIITRSGLSNAAKITADSTSGVKSFMKGAELLLNGDETVCVTGGMVSMSNYPKITEDSGNALKEVLKQKNFEQFIKTDYNNFINASKKRAFHDEIAKIIFRKKGKQIMITEDELLQHILYFNNSNKIDHNSEYLLAPADGAVAFVLATDDYVNKYKIKPIAKIVSFAEESANSDDFSSALISVTEKVLKIGNCHEKQMSRWEVDSLLSDFYVTFENHFNVNPSLVNKDGGVFSSGHLIGLSGAKSLCHLSHSLKFDEFGCSVSLDVNGTASAVILKNLYSKPSTPPRLTLYTKKPCPLCDQLKEELKTFEGRFSLHEINIESEENNKCKELYEYEIPVLFLEGKFLCKHKLDAEHFNLRLLDLERYHS